MRILGSCVSVFENRYQWEGVVEVGAVEKGDVTRKQVYTETTRLTGCDARVSAPRYVIFLVLRRQKHGNEADAIAETILWGTG